MNWKYATILLAIAFIIVNCGGSKEMVADRSRILETSHITAFHPSVLVRVGWVPYQNQKLVKTGSHEWKIVSERKQESHGAIPVLLVNYEGYQDTMLLDMNIDNELLGKLIKHSAMTQQPIQRPFTKFFEYSKCQSCHPEDVKVNFGE